MGVFIFAALSVCHLAPQEVARKRRQPGNLMDFRTIPARRRRHALERHRPRLPSGAGGRPVRTDISIADGRDRTPQAIAVDMGGAMVFPAFVDMHTHLDKGHIWPRSPNPTAPSWARSPPSAPTAPRAGARGPAPAHVVLAALGLCPRHPRDPHASRFHPAAGRHHLARLPGASGRLGRPDRPAGRVPDRLRQVDGRQTGPFGHTADLVAETKGGVLGMVTYPMPDLRDRLKGFFAQAAARGLDADFHVDETMDASVETLRDIAELKIETGFEGRVVVGHCCSLSAQDEARALDTLDLVAKAGHRRGQPADVQPLPAGPDGARRAPHPAPPGHHAGARDARARHPRQLRLRQHARSVLRLWRHGHAGGDARGDAHRPSRPFPRPTGRTPS
jgi:cytosine deaminase